MKITNKYRLTSENAVLAFEGGMVRMQFFASLVNSEVTVSAAPNKEGELIVSLTVDTPGDGYAEAVMEFPADCWEEVKNDET